MGPEGSGTYWRRRIVLLLVLAAVVAAVVWGLTRGGGQPSAAQPSAFDPTPSAAATTAAAAPATATGTASSATAAESPAPSADPARECTATDLTVSVGPDAATYGPDAKPRFRLVVENVSDTPCAVRMGSQVEQLEVTAAGQRVWNSTDCATAPTSRVVELEPGKPTGAWTTWQGIGSEAGCPTGQTRAGAGEYAVTARLGDLTTRPATFTLQ
ncbi:hypothetical protein GCM10023225_23670 [Kineococcus glutinatus]|uniref:DUF4232 domain-containing protein n=1 Tax=Kineococcus glutinatus TaxID=1070872 RepID=A0ABP9HZW2_9ACTN